MKYVYLNRPFAYDQDWIEAFRSAGIECVEENGCESFDELTFLGHSIVGNDVAIPETLTEKCRNRKGKLVVFLGNEWKWFAEKRHLMHFLKADLCVTYIPIESAKKLYVDIPLIEIPHAMGDFYRKSVIKENRNFDIGVRGMKYDSSKIGDNDRASICSESLWKGLRCDMGYGSMLKRTDWRRALNDWRAMPSCEAGIVGAKTIAPRHFEAIGCGTTLVMYEGEFSGILKAGEHYVPLKRDHSNIEWVTGAVLDGIGEQISRRAFDYCLAEHTHAHRIASLMSAV